MKKTNSGIVRYKMFNYENPDVDVDFHINIVPYKIIHQHEYWEVILAIKQLLTDKWAYIATGVKLIVMSFVVMFLVAYLPIASTIKYTIFFLLSMPSATSSAMMAVQYGKDSDFASVGVVLSTIYSIVTLPLLYLFMKRFWVILHN